MKNASAQAAPPPVAACLAGFAICLVGLWLGSPWFLRFAARRLSGDGVLDVYTCEKAGELAWKLLAAGFLVPLVALTAPAFFSWSPRPRMARFTTLIFLASVMTGFLGLAAVTPYRAAAPRSQPDEIQYTIPAVNALERGRLVMVINGKEFPHYTPIGFQLLLIPFYRVFGTMVGNGIRAVQAGALLSIAGVYAVGAAVAGRRRGLLAALLLVTTPGFIFWTGRIMPTTATLALTLAAVLLLLSFRRRGCVVLAALLGAVSGVQLFMSFNTLFTVPIFFILMLCLAARRRGAGRPYACAAAFILAGFFALLPQLLYQAFAYGSPIRTGYFAWFWQAPPPGVARDIPFTLSRMSYDISILELLSKMGLDARVINPVALLLDLVGLGALYNLAVFALFAVGIAVIGRRRGRGEGVIAGFTALFILINYAAYAFYATPGTRFFIQVVPCMLVIAAEGFCSAYAAVRGRFAPWTRLLLCAALAFSFSGAGGAARDRFFKAAPEPCMYEIALAYGETAGEGSVVVSGISGAYLCHFLPAEKMITWLPVSADVRLASQSGRMLFPVASDELGLLRGHIAAGTPVFIDDYYAGAFAREYRLIEKEFSLERARDVCEYGIFRLREKPHPPRPTEGG